MCDNGTHSHEHSHTHAHEHSHDLGHDHNHDHDNCHCHCHEQSNAQSADENTALLTYMIDHNRHHGEDLHELYHSLEKAGKSSAAALVSEAMHFYNHGNDKLAEALKLLGGE